MLFAVTKKCAVKPKRGVNSVEGDPVVENRKVINLLQRASRLQRGSQRLQLSQLPASRVSVFPPFRQIQPHKGFKLKSVLVIICKMAKLRGQMNEIRSSLIGHKRKPQKRASEVVGGAGTAESRVQRNQVRVPGHVVRMLLWVLPEELGKVAGGRRVLRHIYP